MSNVLIPINCDVIDYYTKLCTFVKWMAPKAARKLNPKSGVLEIWTSGPAVEKPLDKPRIKTHPRYTCSYPARNRVQTCYFQFSAAHELASPTVTTQQIGKRQAVFVKYRGHPAPIPLRRLRVQQNLSHRILSTLKSSPYA